MRRGYDVPRWRACVPSWTPATPPGRAFVRSPGPAEPWESDFEPYPGATVLEDLVFTAGDERETAGVVARFVAVQVVIRAVAGELEGVALAEERYTASRYLSDPDAMDRAERSALAEAVRLACRSPERAVVLRLIEAGRAAVRRGCGRGAFALFRLAYTLGVERGWAWEGARSAAAIARLAEAGGGHRSARLWRRRSRVLARRARREHRHVDETG